MTDSTFRRLHLINVDRADGATIAACAAVLRRAEDSVCLIGSTRGELRSRLLGLASPYRIHPPLSRSDLAGRALLRLVESIGSVDQFVAWGEPERAMLDRLPRELPVSSVLIGLEPPRRGARPGDSHLILGDPRDESVWPGASSTTLAVCDPDIRGPDWRRSPGRARIRAALGLSPHLPLVVSIGEPQREIDARRVAWATLVLQNIGMAVTMAIPRSAMHARGAIDLAKRTVRWSPMVIVDEPLAILRVADVGICSLPEPGAGEFGRVRATLAHANRFGVPVICAGWARGMGVDEGLLLPTDRPRDYGTRLADLVADWRSVPKCAEPEHEPDTLDPLGATLRAAIESARPAHADSESGVPA